MLVSSGIGVASSAAGLTLSYLFGLKPGGTIVLIEVGILALILAARAAATHFSDPLKP